MPMDDLYWNSIDFGSEESLHDLTTNKSYVDPWDLENYAYIREHLNSIDVSPERSSNCSGGDFIQETNSTSMYYVPTTNKELPSKGYRNMNKQNHLNEGSYAAIDEFKYEKNINKTCSDYGVIPKSTFHTDMYYNQYEDNYKINSPIYIYENKPKRFRTTSLFTPSKDRSLSFSYGDYEDDLYARQLKSICSRSIEISSKREPTMPLYDDIRGMRRKPQNFGLSNYGHLKIDYSYSWNNLDKYIYQ